MKNQKCDEIAVASYQWGGKGELKYACAGHQAGLQQLCNTMGWPQTFTTIDINHEVKFCGSAIEEGPEGQGKSPD